METATSQTPASVSPLPQPQIPAQPEKRSPKKAFMVLGVVLGVALLGVGIYLFITRNDESTDDAQVEADVVPVGPRVGGSVIKVDVQDNQPVRAGDVLFEIDPAEYDARLAQAQADLSLAQAQEAIVEAQATGGLVSAKAALSGSSIGVAGADQQVAAAEAALARARADQRKAELDYKRTQELFADKAVAQDRMDAAQAAYDGANAALKSTEAQLAAARDAKTQAVTRVAEAEGRFNVAKPIEAQIAAAQARTKSAQAALDLAKLQLSYTKVTASVDGFISRVKLQPGDLLAAGQTVMELVPNHVYVEANFKETQIGHMKPGEPATVTVDALGGRKFKAKVESLSGGTGARFSLLPPDNASGNFVKVVQRLPVRIAFVDLPSDLRLPAGLSVDVTVHED